MLQQLGEVLLIFFVTYEWNQKLVLNYTWLERLVRDEHFSLLGPFIIIVENEGLFTRPDH
jgi:hypothetical protein